MQQTGTYWYHSHTGFQEQTGLHGAIVIDDGLQADRDYVVALYDWSDENPDAIYRKLKLQSDYYNYNKRTVFDFLDEIKRYGFAKALQKRAMWNRMRMDDRDLADVTGATYTYCINDQQTHFHAKRGERVRLRFINQSAMSYFDLRIPGLKMRVIAADGVPVKPVEVDDLRIAVAESYDVIVEPREDTHLIYAESMDRSGKVTATLGKPGRVAMPDPYPFEALTMMDMGMAMKGMKMKHKPTPWPKTKLPMKRGIAWTMEAKMEWK